MRYLACLSLLVLSSSCQKPGLPAGVDMANLETRPVSYEESGEGVQTVVLKTTKGDITIEVHPEWSPKGAERFLTLVGNGFYDGVKFFRVLDNFMAQTGINADPTVHAQWKDKNIMDDPVKKSNVRGYVTFAKTGAPNSRSTQFFINTANNQRLDRDGFAPFGKVTEGMDVVDSLYSGYGEGFPNGRGPDQQMIVARGNAYLEKSFPKLDAITDAEIVSQPEDNNGDADGDAAAGDKADADTATGSDENDSL